jgi:hypothetical protein
LAPAVEASHQQLREVPLERGNGVVARREKEDVAGADGVRRE